MRWSILFLAVLPLAAFAQLQQQQQDPVLRPYKKQMPPAMIVEEENSGIPTSGTAQSKQLRSNMQNRQTGGPTIIQQGKGRGSPTYIIGPDGTRVCTDVSGRTVVCW